MDLRDGKTVFTKIPGKDAVLLIRALGLLVNQAGIYGAAHNVTVSASRSVYNELAKAVNTFGPIEIAVKDNILLVNGSIEGLDAGTGKNLLDRMFLHKIGGLVFLPPLDLEDFLKCVDLFGTQPVVLQAEGGFEEVLNKAGLHTVKVMKVAYRRVAGDAPEPEVTVPPVPVAPKPPEEAAKPQKPAAAPPTLAAARGAVHNLPMAWDLDADLGVRAPAQDGAVPSATESRKRRATELASLLRETASLLEEHDERMTDEEQHQKVVLALNRIRLRLVDSTAESERNIAALASQMDEDRLTIDHIEAEARQRGIGLKLSRSELVERYAELNQEIIQPLTVSTGVLDLLQSGKGGALTEAQLDMLKLAFESVERVNQLVAFMNRVAGLPESLTPDAALIAQTYR